jgi:hypothetical protein
LRLNCCLQCVCVYCAADGQNELKFHSLIRSVVNYWRRAFICTFIKPLNYTWYTACRWRHRRAPKQWQLWWMYDSSRLASRNDKDTHMRSDAGQIHTHRPELPLKLSQFITIYICQKEFRAKWCKQVVNEISRRMLSVVFYCVASYFLRNILFEIYSSIFLAGEMIFPATVFRCIIH